MNGLNWRLVPDDPDRDNIVIVTGFMPSWWTKEYGITFGSDFHLNPDVHRNTLSRMEAILRERFGDLPNFYCGDNYATSHAMERRYGDALIPALFGCSVSFEDASGHPYADGLNLNDVEASNLTVPDMRNHPVTKLLFPDHKNTDFQTTGELGFEGVINIAYKLRGQELFIDMMSNPQRAHHIFEVVWETIDKFVHMVRDWQDPMHVKPTYFVNCDCVVNMISGEMYKNQLLEYEKRFSESFDIFGIHTCNWNIDPYLDALSELEGLAYLDMGADSDIEKVHKLFPDLSLSVFFHPEKLRNLLEQEIKKEIKELGKRIGKGYILFSDLEVGTTDSQIRAAYEAAANL